MKSCKNCEINNLCHKKSEYDGKSACESWQGWTHIKAGKPNKSGFYIIIRDCSGLPDWSVVETMEYRSGKGFFKGEMKVKTVGYWKPFTLPNNNNTDGKKI